MAQKKKKKNRALGLVIALAALVLLIGVYFVIPRGENGEDSPTAAGEEVTWQALEEFSSIEVQGKETLSFENKGGIWSCVQEPARPIDQNLLQTMASSLMNLTPVRMIAQQAEDLSQYGLGDDAVRIRAEEQMIVLGDVNAVSGDRYVLWTDGKVYTAKASQLDLFSLSLVELTAMESLPSMTAADVSNLRVTDAEGEVLIELIHEEKPRQDDPTQSYLWYVTQDGETRAAQTTKAQTVANAFVNVALGACAEYESDDAILAQYGLDKPSYVIEADYTLQLTGADGTVTRGKPKQFRLEVGRIDADGTAYVRFDDCRGIYTANGANLTAAAMTAAQDLWPMDWINVSSGDLQRLNFAVDGSFLEFTFRNEETANEDGTTSSVRKIFLNGSEVSATDFSYLYSSLVGLKVEDRVIGAQAQSEEMVMAISLNVGDEPLAIKLLPYNTSFYLADMNGTRELLLSRREVDALAQEVKEFLISYSQVPEEP